MYGHGFSHANLRSSLLRNQCTICDIRTCATDERGSTPQNAQRTSCWGEGQYSAECSRMVWIRTLLKHVFLALREEGSGDWVRHVIVFSVVVLDCELWAPTRSNQPFDERSCLLLFISPTISGAHSVFWSLQSSSPLSLSLLPSLPPLSLPLPPSLPPSFPSALLSPPVNCWPSENAGKCEVNIEYELLQSELELTDVIISIPCPWVTDSSCLSLFHAVTSVCNVS